MTPMLPIHGLWNKDPIKSSKSMSVKDQRKIKVTNTLIAQVDSKS